MSDDITVLPVLLPDIEKITQDYPHYEGEPIENYFFRLLEERLNLERAIVLEIVACMKAAQLQEINNIMQEAILNGEQVH